MSKQQKTKDYLAEQSQTKTDMPILFFLYFIF